MQPPLNVGKIDYFLGVPKFLRRVSFFSFRFNVKANSHYVGGNNVFGKGFGDHNQDVIVQAHYKDENQYMGRLFLIDFAFLLRMFL